MGYRPKWRAPFKVTGGPRPVQSAAFLAKRPTVADHRRCQATARMTGKQCRLPAMRGAQRCRSHGGLEAAAVAEAELYGRPVIILRRKHQRALAALGSREWPEGLERRADLLELGPVARGRLFEAYMNRELDPKTYRHELRLRPRRAQSKK
jgi:hypothetical protein